MDVDDLLSYVGVAVGFSLFSGIIASAELPGSSKYVCASESNSVLMMKIVDVARILFAVAAVAMYIRVVDIKSKEQAFTSFSNDKMWCAVFGGVSVAIFIGLFISTGVVCSSDTCIQQSAVNSCKNAQGADCTEFKQQVKSMTNISTLNSVCAKLSWWETNKHYCKEDIANNCYGLTTEDSAAVQGAEECVIFGCTDLVFGYNGFFWQTVVGFFTLIISFATLYYVCHVSESAEAQTSDHIGGDLATPTAILPMPAQDGPIGSEVRPMPNTIRRRTNRPDVYYSSVPNNIKF